MEVNLYKELCEIAGEDCVKQNEPMKKHTTFRMGGDADIFVEPDNVEAVQNVIKLCKEKNIPWYVIGNGSNLLVSDEGFRGVILQIGSRLCAYEKEQGVWKVQAGAMLTKIAKEMAKEGYKGMEFAVGIPGTVGGAVTMNAGAYGGEIKDTIVKVVVVDKNGEVITLSKEELQLGYRTSVIAKEGYVVLEAEFSLEQGDTEEIMKICNENTKARVEKQPLEYPSAGSTFKRPEGYFAGKLIMDAGLRGFSVGDAQVSEKHCGFLINKGNATASDMCQLIEHVQKVVKENYGVTLETEVKMIGF